METCLGQSYCITIVNEDVNYRCSKDKSLLQGAESVMGAFIPVGCRGGGCGVCKIKILQGEYKSKRMSSAHISDSDMQQGFVLACRVYPCSDMLIETMAIETKTAENPDNE
jgi:ferredoxin